MATAFILNPASVATITFFSGNASMGTCDLMTGAAPTYGPFIEVSFGQVVASLTTVTLSVPSSAMSATPFVTATTSGFDAILKAIPMANASRGFSYTVP